MIVIFSSFFLPSLVGRWSPRHVLQHPICLQGYSLPSIRGGESRASGAGGGAPAWRTGHGDPRPTMVCLARS